ncbi:amidohydrolase [Psychromicrobium lacuslunae]|uniref:Amidohydrolase n=1 Tax=Psychromicrobium lacuslunae TaxID=1618207 RepID=A0A0D4BXT2_9MICC|nr:amidohydrolase family protein [Psychromicrobium lacuslunae]AJT40940.1 amidohydrolase [Psychromicrobium lacuslunae]
MSLTLYRNGSVYSAADPLATAMLVDGDTVAWVGGEHAASSLQDGRMRVVDLQGALITPGFVDSHVHLTETGLALESLDLSQVRSAQELLAAVASVPESVAQVIGFGWDETLWTDPVLPSPAQLGRASGGREVYLARVDVHSALVSDALASRLGLAELDDWLGDGQVVRAAHVAVRDAVRQFSQPRRRELQQLALRSAARAGYVALAEMAIPAPGTVEDLSLLMEHSASAEYPQVLPYLAQLISSAEQGRDLLRDLAEQGVVPLGFAGDLNIDGSIGSRTALLREDYQDLSGHRGSQYLSEVQIAEHLAACSELGIQGGFHVIGDRGMDLAVQGLRSAEKQVGKAAIRAAAHRFEHAELADAEAINSLADYAVTVSMQASFDALWGGADGLYQQRLGARANGMNQLAAMYGAGVPVALGSDSPVTPLNPWASVKACLEHHQPEQRISARAAFIAHSRAGWRAAREPNPLIGQLAPGAPASYAIWQVDELMVQVADERVQSWSTDPRSRTPLLPALDTENLPRCLATVHRGAQLFWDDSAL